ELARVVRVLPRPPVSLVDKREPRCAIVAQAPPAGERGGCRNASLAQGGGLAGEPEDVVDDDARPERDEEEAEGDESPTLDVWRPHRGTFTHLLHRSRGSVFRAA